MRIRRDEAVAVYDVKEGMRNKPKEERQKIGRPGVRATEKEKSSSLT